MVDDDPAVCTIMTEKLEAIGLTVLSARDGADALAQLQSADQAIQLVILDLLMPVMDGVETFTRLRQLQPALPVLICSGIALEPSTADRFAGENWRFLRKPFTSDRLHSEIVQLLQL